MKVKIRKFIGYCLKKLKFLLLYFFLITLLLALIYRFIPVYLTPLMVIRTVDQVFGEEELRVKKDWVSLDEINSNMVLAVVAAEDQKYLDHFGFDIEAINKAIQTNQKKGSGKKGGSSISQQTAKNVFLWPKRSWIRKGMEVYFTLMIELCWNKKRTMEVYLNVIETGKGIYGVEAASQFYFKKSAAKLSRNEAALIAAILPDPRHRNPAKPSSYLLKRQNWILGQMNNLGKIDLER